MFAPREKGVKMASGTYGQPLYVQLVDALREKIDSDMEPGDLLPSERELSEHYGLSRTTVRQALRELESMGLVDRRHGKGTFVAEPHVEATNLSGTYSFTEQMRRLGCNPSTQIIDFGVVDAPKQVASNLDLPLGGMVYSFRRLRLADGVPMMVERTYLPASVFPGLTSELLEHNPLYDVIEKRYGVIIREAKEEFSASLASGEEAFRLGISEGSAVLRLVRRTRDDVGQIVEYTHSVARADQFKYKITHYRGQPTG